MNGSDKVDRRVSRNRGMEDPLAAVLSGTSGDLPIDNFPHILSTMSFLPLSAPALDYFEERSPLVDLGKGEKWKTNSDGSRLILI